MLIYSESFHVEHSIKQEWITWVNEILIAELKNTQLFSKIIFFKVISHSDDSGDTFSLQCYLKEDNNLALFHKDHADNISLLVHRKFNNKVLAFKTELELLNSLDI